jgi:hypothetical protein
LPERNSYGEVMKGYFSLMRGFGIEFANRSDRVLVPELGIRWFDEYVQRRSAEDPVHVRRRQSPEDPSFFLGEYLRAPETVYRAVIPNTGDLRVVSKKIVDTRNTWLHFSDEPSVSQLREAADLVRLFGLKASMSVEAAAARMIKRIDRIRTGQYPSVSPAVAAAPAGLSAPAAPSSLAGGERESPAEIPLTTSAQPSRPPIGGIWRGGISDRRVRVTKTRDVVDVASGRSIRDEVDGPLAEKVRQWTSARPMGDLWVGEDGAIGGFIEGRERLLGYTGPDPETEIARGFLVRRYYDVVGERLVDIDSGSALSDMVANEAVDEVEAIEESVVTAAQPGGTIRVTNYGDVLYMDEQGMTRVAVVTPQTWFPGHLN